MSSVFNMLVLMHLAGLLVCTSAVTNNAAPYNYSTPAPMDSTQVLLQRLATTRFIVWRICVPLVITFGIFGNAINIAVLTQKVMRTSSTNTYLSVLAVFDVLYLIFGLTMGLKHYDPDIVNRASYIRYRKPFGKPIVDTCSNTTIWLTLTFTVERYIGVCHPMKGRRWCTPERARYITFAVCAAAAIITFPEFFEYEITTKIDPMTNETLILAGPSTMGKSSSYQWGYVYLNQALFTFLPLLLLVAFNSLLMRAVLASARRRRDMAKICANERQDRQQREQTKITIMLIAVVIVFIFCQLPQAINNLYVTYLNVTDSVSEDTMIKVIIANNIFNLLVQLNSSMNFVLYSCFSLRFRRVFKRLFCRCLASEDRPAHSIFTEQTHDGSKTNLILHSSAHANNHAQAASCSPRSRDIVNSSTENRRSGNPAPSPPYPPQISLKPGTPPKTKNGYLEVDQGASCL